MNLQDRMAQLNSYQFEAVKNEEQACIVNAVVGSGKTLVLTTKVAYLHEVKKVAYEDMLVLTFTNKAADEIKNRCFEEDSIETDEQQLSGFGTFHAVAMQLLKEKLPIETLGYQKDFEIIEPEEELALALSLVEQYKLTIKYKNRLAKRLEQAMQIEEEHKQISKYKDDIFVLCKHLKEEKKRINKMSFADLLSNATLLMKDSSYKAKWILVDEVQDCNMAQVEFISSCCDENTKLFFVGDPNQVIYSWRGSDASVFYTIKHRFQAKELTLPVNYRSSAIILEAAKRFQQNASELSGVIQEGNPIHIVRQYDAFNEANWLAGRIKEMKQQGIALKDIAIFYRLQEQASVIADVFHREEIPHQIVMKRKPEDHPEIPFGQELIEEDYVDSEQVHLMTLHASKGLEFAHVFIIGVNNGLIPLKATSFEMEEEERRLFFVGMTRAKLELTLTYYTNPSFVRAFPGDSRYLRMIPEHLTIWEGKQNTSSKESIQKLQQLKKQVQEEKQKYVSSDVLEKPVMETTKSSVKRVRHAKYGVGSVITEDDMMIQIDFDDYGKKEFMKMFEKFEYI